MRIDSPSITGSLIVSSSSSNEHSFMGANVGIGLTDPVNKLHVRLGSAVSSAGTDTGDTVIFEDSADQRLNLITGTSRQNGIFFSDTTRGVGRIDYIHSTDTLATTVGSTKMLELTSTKISGSATTTGSFGEAHISDRIGIGTTSPTAPLHIFQDNSNTAISPTPGILIEQDGTGDSVLQFLLTGTKRWIAGIDNSDSDKFKITHGVSDLNDADVFTIDTNSNVNIGGNTAFGFTPALGIEGTQPALLLKKDANDFFHSSVGDGFAYIIFDHEAQLQIGSATNVGGTSFSRDLVIDGATGNVGIGTSSPSRALHVAGDALVTGILTAQEFHTEFVSASVLFDSGSTKFGDDVGDVHNFTGSLFTSGSNFSVGTSAVHSTVNLFSPSSTQIQFYDNASTVASGRGVRVGWNGSVGQFWVFENAGFRIATNNTERFTIDSSGNVGINDSTPTAQLDITTSASGKYGLQVNNNSGNQIFAVYNSGGQDAIINIGNDGGATKIQLLADGNSYFDGGNVGIGTTSPNAKLEVAGNISGSSVSTGSFGDGRFAGRVGIGTVNPTDYHPDADNLVIYSSGRTGITIAGGTSDSSNIFFADGTSGTAEYEGAIQFLHSSNAFAFGIANSTAMKLDTNSRISLSNNDTSATGGGDSTSGNTIIGWRAANTLVGSSNGGYQSVIIGHRAGEDITTGDNNLIIGNQAGKEITTSGANVFLGTHAGGSVAAGQTDTDGTIAIGYFAANQLTSAIKTVAIGYTAMQNQTTGNRNTVIGYGAMYTADGGEDFNVIIGSEAGYSINNDASHDNVLIGMNACQGGSGTFLGNVGIGSRVMNGVTNNSQTGTVAIGSDALYTLTSGEGNLAIGYKALYAEDDGHYNTGIGYEAFTDQTGTTGQVGNTGIGYKVGHELTSGMENTYLGMFAGRYNKTGNQNTYIGFLAGRGNSNQSNTGNTAVGNYAMAAISTGTQNVAVGSGSLRDISDGIRNTSVGAFSAHNVTSGLDNVAVGANSGFALTTGDYNTAIGAYALYTEDIGRGTVAVGNAALYSQDSDSSDEITRNVGIGQESGHFNVTGQYNTYVGYRAGYGVSGNSHLSTVAIGTQALNGITTGNYNTAIGDRAGYTLTTTTSTVLIGFQAGYGLNSTDANGAVMIGYRAGSIASHPAGSTLIGSGSGGQITYGDSNTIVGSTAGATITTGGGNTIVGQFACGFSGATLSGDYNTVMGYTAGQNLGGAANRNVMIGRNAGQTATTSSGSVFIGEEAGADCTTGNQNIAIGQNSMAEGTTTGDGNISIGTLAGYQLTSGFMNVFIGNQAGEATTTAYNNTAVGERAMHLNQSGNANVAIGRSALENTTTGLNNTAVGQEAMGGITSGIAIQDCVAVGLAAFKGSSSTTTGASGTVAVGRLALNALTSGAGNTAIGYASMQNGGTINTSTAVGYATLQNGTSGMVGNTAIGYGVLDAANNSGADDNTGVGKEALGQLASGAQNVAVGKDAGNSLLTGNNNVLIGKNANASATDASNQTAIGKDATGVADNSVTLGNSDVTDVYMAEDAGAKVRCSAIVHTQENVTISSGAITVTSSYVRVLTEGSASSDDLDTINGGVAGQVLYLQTQFSTKDVTLKDMTGNLALAGDFTLDHALDMIHLIYSAADSVWIEVSRSNNN